MRVTPLTFLFVPCYVAAVPASISHPHSHRHSGEGALRRLELIEAPQQVEAPPGMVYSTDPHEAMAEDGMDYILKGPDASVVFAEAAAYELAGLLDLPVPPCAGCIDPASTDVWFGSREMQSRFSLDHLLARDRVQNSSMIPQTIVFDVWIGNPDRNMGNFVGATVGTDGTSAVNLRAIDFEKAQVLRGDRDEFRVTAMDPEGFWPAGELGEICSGFTLPTTVCDEIQRLVEGGRIAGVLEQLVWDLDFPDVPWLDAAVRLLTSRGHDIRMWAEEAWHG